MRTNQSARRSDTSFRSPALFGRRYRERLSEDLTASMTFMNNVTAL
jgi:hypothetical protein